MRISIDRKALQWFQEELCIKHGESVRFTVRYGGIVQFSLDIL